MSTTRIPPALRSEVIEHAQGRCEYCQVPQEAELIDYEIDHITAEQHGGKTESDNLAYTCLDCNRHKGPNLTSIDPQTGAVTRLFNPRTQKWVVSLYRVHPLIWTCKSPCFVAFLPVKIGLYPLQGHYLQSHPPG